MPVCKKCGERFPNVIIIGTKRHNLQRRKFCLNCSPWKQHNTKNLVATPLGAKNYKEVTCKLCKRVYFYNRKKGHTTTICNSCMANRKKCERKKKALEYKGNKCSICGYDKYTGALQFHHVDPSKKDFSLSGNHGRSWEKYKIELDKCVILCANCHAELHSEENIEYVN